jgi:hypothetical protein
MSKLREIRKAHAEDMAFWERTGTAPDADTLHRGYLLKLVDGLALRGLELSQCYEQPEDLIEEIEEQLER